MTYTYHDTFCKIRYTPDTWDTPVPSGLNTGITLLYMLYKNKRPMGLDALLENLAIDKSSRQIRADFPTCHIRAWNFAIGKSCTYTLFLPQGVEMELIFDLWAAVFDIRNCHIWAWNLAKSSRSCTYRLSVYLPQGEKFELIFDLFIFYRPSSFQDMGWFSKLPHLGMKLGHWPKFQKLAHMMFFYPRGSKLGSFSLYGQRFPRYWPFSKLP